MKKVVVAIFLAIMMLLVPVSTVGRTVNNHSGKNILSVNNDPPIIYITEEEYGILNLYIDDNFQDDDHALAKTILGEITSYDSEYEKYIIDVNELADALDIYSYNQPIPDEYLTEEYIENKQQLIDLINDYWLSSPSPIGDFIKKIIEILQLRLGWMYELVYRGGVLFVDGVNLAIDFITQIQSINWAITFAILFNLIVSIPLTYFSDALRTLFNDGFDEFKQIISDFAGAFTDELDNFVSAVQAILDIFEDLFDDIKEYIADIADFIDWIRGDNPYEKPPWEKAITVSGNVKTVLTSEPYSDLDVTCRGVTVVTDGQGGFEFEVEPSGNAADSKPENSWYGLHNCNIVISKDGVVKRQTPVLLSYVFSDGEITWQFFVAKSRSRFTELQTIFLERFSFLFERIYSLYPLLFQRVNTVV